MPFHPGQKLALSGIPVALAGKVVLYRPGATDFLLRLPIAGSAAGAEFRLHQFTGAPAAPSYGPSYAWHYYGTRVLEPGGAVWTLMDPNSATEYAFEVDTTNAPQTGAHWGFYGSLHQNQAMQSFSLQLDGVEMSGMAVGAWAAGTTVYAHQTLTTYLPYDGATLIGGSTLDHTVTAANRLQVEHWQTFSSPGSYQLFTDYAAMLPTTNGDGRGCDTYQIGSNTATARAYDGADHFLGTQTATYKAWHATAHPYKLIMTLPDNGPDVNGDWSKAGSGWKGWFRDNADHSIGKVYVNWVSGTYSERVTALNSHHRTVYDVTL